MNAKCVGHSRITPLRSGALALAGIAGAVAAFSGPRLAVGGHQVPLAEQLMVMTAVVSENQGDYESIKIFRELTPTSVRIAGSAEAPDDSGEVREINVARVVRREDLRNSKVLRTYFHEFDAQAFPGTTPMFSAAMVNDVRSTGLTHATYLEIEPEFGSTVLSRTMTGALKRVGTGAFTVTVPVNCVPQALRALHVAGRVADEGDGADFDFVVLDNPLILRGKGPEFPPPPRESNSLCRQPLRAAIDQLYGILYPELRALAYQRVRGSSNAVVLDTTSLVYDSYLRFVKAAKIAVESHKQFLAYAARVLRSV